MKKIQLSIPEPCQENWDAMTPTQQGRFCNACAKEVIDFSNMSDSEVLNYFLKKKNEKVCGQVYTDQLERNITVLPKKKWYWYLNYIAAFVLFTAKSGTAKAQKNLGAVVYVGVNPTANYVLASINNEVPFKKRTINGVVKDEKGNPVPFASVKLLGSLYGVSSDEKGMFTLEINKLNSSIEVSSLNFTTKRSAVNDLSYIEIILQQETKTLPDVVITAPTNCTRRSLTVGGMWVKGEMIGTSKKTIKDTVISWFSPLNNAIKIYPNPVPKGSSFTVSMKLKQTGKITIQLTDAAGRLLTEKKINVVSKQHNEQVAIANTWSAGLYYVKLVDDKGKLITTGSLVVQ